MREALIRLKKEGNEEDAAYILMQRIFPTVSSTFLLRDGICHKDNAISELGVFGAYLRYITYVSKPILLLLLFLIKHKQLWFSLYRSLNKKNIFGVFFFFAQHLSAIYFI